MPLGTFHRLPIPTLTTYTIISTALFVSFVYNAKQVVENPGWKQELESRMNRNGTELVDVDEQDDHLVDMNDLNLPDPIKDVLTYMIQDGFSRWVFINAITCAVVLFGKVIQRLVFGDLRTIEIHNFREKLCTYFLYKCIFMFGVIKVQTTEDVIFLLCWFGLLGFLQILVQLSRDRLEYMVTVSSHITFWSRCKIVTLLLSIFCIAGCMIYLCLAYGVNLGYNIFAFMIAECLSITLRVPHILIKFVVDPFEAKFIRNQHQRFRGRNSFANFIISRIEMSLTYYVSLILELADLCLELLHYLHMVLWSNALISVASFALCMHVRNLTTEIQKKIKKHRNYIWILNHMEKEYPMASDEELKQNSDNCAICWEKMEVARKLPCRHLFHTTCLQLWLEQDTSCPTCRYVLNLNGTNARRTQAGRQPARGVLRIGRNAVPLNRQHFFHFDGSRYVSWLPSFSVQVMSTIGPPPELVDSQLEHMAREVQQVFPHYPTHILIEDLRQTRSINVTSNNIVDGLLPLEPEPESVDETQIERIAAANVSEASSSGTSASALFNSNEPINETDNTEFDIIESELEFSPSPTEREAALRARKERMFSKARKKFLKKRENNFVTDKS